MEKDQFYRLLREGAIYFHLEYQFNAKSIHEAIFACGAYANLAEYLGYDPNEFLKEVEQEASIRFEEVKSQGRQKLPINPNEPTHLVYGSLVHRN